ncbi:MAG: alkS [Nocardia sp.]|uniref:helix-turn-helix transcriptional regulator n=1 Tax=Nocardia sp. TaxID=1821 RepID=UPI00263631A7|nr:helix-turn-helix transcriptional regulator [Nocardia sp.]MCU1648047.1 alkS [Nocardia sp.]
MVFQSDSTSQRPSAELSDIPEVIEDHGLHDAQSIRSLAGRGVDSYRSNLGGNSVSDVLSLIDVFAGTSDSAAILDYWATANLLFLRGEPHEAKHMIDDMLALPGLSKEIRREATALRLLLLSLVDEQSGSAQAEITLAPNRNESAEAATAVAMIVLSNQRWYYGSLAEGLWLNQFAIATVTADMSARWLLCAKMVLAKKLIDLRATRRAELLLQDMELIIDQHGLDAYQSVTTAVRATLLLEAGQFDLARETAAKSLQTAHDRGTTIGRQLARSVLAEVGIRVGDDDDADRWLRICDDEPVFYCFPDAAIRLICTRLRLTEIRTGSDRAVEQAIENWPQLSVNSQFFLTDPARPAWLAEAALRTGHDDFAHTVAHATRDIALRNPHTKLLDAANGYVAAAFTRNGIELERRPDLPRSPRTPPRFAGNPTASFPSTPAADPAPPAPTFGSRPAAPARAIPFDDLTNREIEIVELVTHGLTNRQIAARVGLSPHTVNFHLRKVFQKLRVQSRVELASVATRLR